MTDKQIIAGLILNSLLYSLGDKVKSVKTRDKFMASLKRKLSIERKNNKRFNDLIDKANEAFKESWKEFPDGIYVAIPKIAKKMTTEYSDYFKPYKVNQKYIDKMIRVDGMSSVFDDFKVARSLMDKVWHYTNGYTATMILL